MDRLILERWTDVIGLLEAQRQTQDRIQEMIDVVGERLERWAQPLGYEIEANAKDAEFYAWRSAWADRRRGAKVHLVLGGFCPHGYRKTEESHPYLWVYTDMLENFKVKEPERAAFARSLRAALGDAAKRWEADGIDDDGQPLGRRLTDISDADRPKLVASPDALYDFAVAHFPTVFELSDTIETELAKLAR
jgi:hypothetical protein